ncbi:MAG: RluA family pseudouridine synthase, partial [Akkermansiaceae bacterium]|nr:RluA family pseudouridine synthase [Akkermansiaceae bacterium]
MWPGACSRPHASPSTRREKFEICFPKSGRGAQAPAVTITVQDEDAGQRLDLFLAGRLEDLSRSRLQALVKSGHIMLNDEQSLPKAQVSAGDVITVEIPEPEVYEVTPQDIPLEILFEDEDLIVINKPSGLVVHPAAGNPDGTLVNALLHHCRGSLSGIGGVERPGIVHRLDKDTSGCLVAAKSDRAQQSLVTQFHDRKVTKLYLAAVQRIPPKPSGTIFTHLGRHPVSRQKMAVVNPGSGRPAITDYYVLHRDPGGPSALVLCHLHTGRTHQIRVHLRHLGTPVLGDPVYGRPDRQPGAPPRLLLHAWRLAFAHPVTGKPVSCEAPVPAEFAPYLPKADLLDRIRRAEP